MEPHHGHKRMKPTFWCDGCHKDFRSSRDYNIHVERGRSCVIQVKTVADNGGKNSRDGDSRNAQPDQKENNHTGEEICNMNYSSEGEGVREFVDDSVESTDAFHTRPSAPADIRITRFQRQSTLPNNPASIKGNKVASPDGDPGDFCQPHVEESLNAKKETSSITDLVGVDLLSHLMLDLKLSNFQLSSLVAPILAGPARELLEVVPLGRGPLSADQRKLTQKYEEVQTPLTSKRRGIIQRMLALSSFGFNMPRRGRFTKGGMCATPTVDNNPFVAAGVIFTKPDEDTVQEQAASFLKSMESPRSRVVVQPCQAAVRTLIEKVVEMVPDKKEMSEDRLAFSILDLVRKTPTKAEVQEVFEEFAACFFDPTLNAHARYWNHRHNGITWRDVMGNNRKFEEDLFKKVIPKVVENSTDLLRKIDLVHPKPSAAECFLLKTRGAFRKSEKETVPDSCAVKGGDTIWSRWSSDGNTWRSGMWDILGYALSDSDGPYTRLSKMEPSKVTMDYVIDTIMPYNSRSS